MLVNSSKLIQEKNFIEDIANINTVILYLSNDTLNFVNSSTRAPIRLKVPQPLIKSSELMCDLNSGKCMILGPTSIGLFDANSTSQIKNLEVKDLALELSSVSYLESYMRASFISTTNFILASNAIETGLVRVDINGRETKKIMIFNETTNKYTFVEDVKHLRDTIFGAVSIKGQEEFLVFSDLTTMKNVVSWIGLSGLIEYYDSHPSITTVFLADGLKLMAINYKSSVKISSRSIPYTITSIAVPEGSAHVTIVYLTQFSIYEFTNTALVLLYTDSSTQTISKILLSPIDGEIFLLRPLSVENLRINPEGNHQICHSACKYCTVGLAKSKCTVCTQGFIKQKDYSCRLSSPVESPPGGSLFLVGLTDQTSKSNTDIDKSSNSESDSGILSYWPFFLGFLALFLMVVFSVWGIFKMKASKKNKKEIYKNKEIRNSQNNKSMNSSHLENNQISSEESQNHINEFKYSQRKISERQNNELTNFKRRSEESIKNVVLQKLRNSNYLEQKYLDNPLSNSVADKREEDSFIEINQDKEKKLEKKSSINIHQNKEKNLEEYSEYDSHIQVSDIGYTRSVTYHSMPAPPNVSIDKIVDPLESIDEEDDDEMQQ